MNVKIIIALFAVVLMAGNALAYTVDGDISDWGVNLSAAFGGDNSSWHPSSSTADFSIEDNMHPDATTCDWTGYCEHGYHTQAEPKTNGYYEPAGGEHYDIEAMYFDDDSQYGYFAVVLSMAPTGYTDRYNRHVDPGDLAIDLDNDPSTGQYGYEYGIKTTGPDAGQVCYMPRWTLPQHSIGLTDNAPSTMHCDGASSVVRGKADLVYADAGVSDLNYDKWNGYENLPNYVIETRVNKTFLNNPSAHKISNLHTTLTCGNDAIEINHYQWDYDVPEFGTIAAALVLIGAGTYITKRRKK